MNLFRSYIFHRLLQWLIVIFIGTTVIFMVPRFSSVNPVNAVMASFASYQTTDPQAMEELKNSLEDMMGLNENIFIQYFKFWERLLRGNLGPSLAQFPTPVIRVIGSAMPWTISLLLMSTILSWLLGIILGTVVAYWSQKSWSKILQVIIMSLYPIPYYVMALILVMLFVYIFPVFPLFGGIRMGLKPSLSLSFILSAIKHGFLPAISIILGSIGWRFMSQRALVSTLLSSDFVTYARIAGVRNRKISFYLFRNSLLPQATDLALSLGGIFSGALITEVVFSYPGVGQILYLAILQSDYNLVMGISVFSIIGVATGALIIDLLYPFLDPRIRYS